ncbi:MAG: glycosyltransferase family 4 protein [Steroidobacteraceae bacterium]
MLISPHVGGGAKLAMEIHKHALATRGPVSQLFVPPGGEAERSVRAAGFAFTPYRVDRLTTGGPVASMLENLALSLKAARHGEGLVHVHAPFVYGAARSFFRASRLRTVLHVHLDFTAKDLDWALESPPDLLVLCADFMRTTVEQVLEAKRAARSRIRTVRNAVDTGRFFPGDRAAEKARLGEQADVPLLMVVANLAPHKGQETALRAVKVLKESGHRVRLWIVGAERSDGQGHLHYLQTLRESLQLDTEVNFAGFRSDVPALLRAADFVLLPSTSEGLPLVLLEAQASRALTLAAPTAGVPEIIHHGKTGFLVAADDHRGYAHHLAHLITHPLEATAIADAAHQAVRDNHSMHHYCDQIFAAYDELLPPSRPHRRQ